MFGFYDEVQHKLPLELFGEFLKFFNYQPCAVIVESKNRLDTQRYWLCHGGFPINHTIQDWLATDSMVFCIQDTDAVNQIRWSDFYSNYDIDGRIIEDSYNFFRGIGRIYTAVGRDLETFMRRSRIDMIIRGHQDFYGNSVLLSRIPLRFDKYYAPCGIILDTNPTINTNALFTDFDYGVSYDDGIYRIQPKMIRAPFAKVLTISTNTDLGRLLDGEGFVLVSF